MATPQDPEGDPAVTNEADTEWRSSCCTANKKAIIFFSQLSVSLISLGVFTSLSIVDPANKHIYIPIMTSILGYWMPQPKMN